MESYTDHRTGRHPLEDRSHIEMAHEPDLSGISLDTVEDGSSLEGPADDMISVSAAAATYDSLPLAERKSTRVLRILPQDGDNIACQLEVISLDDDPPPEYYALSYVWGSPSEARCITVNNEPFLVRRNLWNCLYITRKRQFRDRLWIDAICIDQTCIPERNHQVSVMGDIYRSATRVIVWLGTELEILSYNSLNRKPEQPGTEMLKKGKYSQASVFDCFQLMEQDLLMPMDPQERPPEGSHATVGAQRREVLLLLLWRLEEFCNAKYWTRLWIVQEYVLAKDTEILTDRSQMYGSKLLDIYFSTCSKARSSIERLDLDHRVRNISGHIYFTPGMCILRTTFGRTTSLERLILEFMHSDCFDQRDHVYALLSLAEDGTSCDSYAISPDYSRSEVLLYIELTYKFYRMGNVDEQSIVSTVPANFAFILGIRKDIAEEVVSRVRERIQYDGYRLGPRCSGREVADDISRLLS